MDATNCYLFFQRLALKVDLINTFVAHAHNLPDALNGSVTELLVGVCEVRPQRPRTRVSTYDFRTLDEGPSVELVHDV